MRAMNTCAGLAIVLLCLTTIGCDSKISEGHSPGSQTGTPAAESLKITEIRIGKGNDTATDPLTTADPIVAFFKTTGTTTGAQLEAKLFNLSNGQVVAIQAQKVVTAAPSMTTLTFKSADRWLAGRYLLEVKIDGKLAEQRDIDIIEATPKSDAK